MHFLFYFNNPEACQEFINTVVTTEWVKRIDSGHTLNECIEEAVQLHPQYEEPVRMYQSRWQETISGPVAGMEDVVKQLKERYPVYGLSNWNLETFTVTRSHEAILQQPERTE